MMRNLCDMFYFLLVFFGFLHYLAYGLYEDQVGKFDWRFQLVGKVSHAVFDSSSSGGSAVKSSIVVPSKIAFVASSEQNVIAAVELKSGDLVWRRVLEQPKSGKFDEVLDVSRSGVDSLILNDRTSSVLTLSSGGQYLRSWGKVKGTLHWETSVSDETCKNQFFRDVRWFGGFTTEDSSLMVFGGTAENEKIYVRTLNSWNGAVNHETKIVEAPWFSSEKKCTLVKNSLVCLAKNGNKIYSMDVTKELLKVMSINLEKPVSELAVLSRKVGILVAVEQEKYTLLKVSSESGLEVFEEFDKVSAAGVVEEIVHENVDYSALLVVATLTEDKKEQILNWYKLFDGQNQNQQIAEWSGKIYLGTERAPFISIFPSIGRKQDGSMLPRILGVSSDGSLSYILSSGKVGWTRLECLASILSVEMLDLPLSEAQANIEREFSAEAGTEWIQKSSFLERAGFLLKQKQATNQQGIVEGVFERDYFDLHKMIVVATKDGKLLGLDNRNGKMIWQIWIDDLEALGFRGDKVDGADRLVLPLFVQRTTAQYPHPAQCMLVGKHKASEKGYSISFNPISGVLIEKEILDFEIGQALGLPYTNEVEVHGVLLVAKDTNAGISAMGVTDTEKGLSSRQLLLAMPFGGLLEMPKILLDPRRVLIPTRETAEEGLMPYIPDLPVATEHILNYNQSLLRIQRIYAAPSGLESTSLVLAYGLDIYYTRINPSGTFDILKDDFDHWFISAVLTGLILASIVSKKLAKHRDLKLAWK